MKLKMSSNWEKIERMYDWMDNIVWSSFVIILGIGALVIANMFNAHIHIVYTILGIEFVCLHLLIISCMGYYETLEIDLRKRS